MLWVLWVLRVLCGLHQKTPQLAHHAVCALARTGQGRHGRGWVQRIERAALAEWRCIARRQIARVPGSHGGLRLLQCLRYQIASMGVGWLSCCCVCVAWPLPLPLPLWALHAHTQILLGRNTLRGQKIVAFLVGLLQQLRLAALQGV